MIIFSVVSNTTTISTIQASKVDRKLDMSEGISDIWWSVMIAQSRHFDFPKSIKRHFISVYVQLGHVGECAKWSPNQWRVR